MNDIHAIIAAAKRVQRQQPFDGQDAAMWVALGDARIAMAEALIRVDALLANGRYGDAAMVIGDCLDKIVKEVQ